MSRLQKTLLLVLLSLCVFLLGRLALYLRYADAFSSLPTAGVLLAFADGMRFDLSILLAFFSFPLVMMNLPVERAERPRWFNAWAWVVYAVFIMESFILTADIIYFDHVKRHIGRELMALTNDIDFITSFIVKSQAPALLGFFCFALLFFLLWKKVLSSRLVPGRFAVARFLVIAALLVTGIRGSFSRKPLSIIDAFRTGDTAYGNLVLNGPFSAFVSSRKSTGVSHTFYSGQELYRNLGLEQKEFPLLRSFSGQKTNYNIVFVLMESWGYKYVDSFSGAKLGVTPCFDALVAEGVKFENFYAMGQRSIEAIQAVLTGVPILPGIPYIGYGLEVSGFSQLGRMARNNGYSSIFVQSFRRRSYRIDSVARLCGFDEYYGMEDIPVIYDYPEQSRSTTGWDYDTFLFLKKKLDAMGKPFLAFMFTGTNHGPFADLPAQFLKYPHDPGNENGYLNTLYYSDWALGEFMEEARKSPWFDRTVFIFCPDHALQAYEKFPFLKRCHIPFLVYAPKIFRPGTKKEIASQLDIMPTIIDILGFQDEFATWGESLFRKREEFAIVTEGDITALITPKGYIRHSLTRLQKAVSFQDKPLDEQEIKEMEKKLLSIDQMTFELLEKNKWAK